MGLFPGGFGPGICCGKRLSPGWGSVTGSLSAGGAGGRMCAGTDRRLVVCQPSRCRTRRTVLGFAARVRLPAFACADPCLDRHSRRRAGALRCAAGVCAVSRVAAGNGRRGPAGASGVLLLPDPYHPAAKVVWPVCRGHCSDRRGDVCRCLAKAVAMKQKLLVLAGLLIALLVVNSTV